jgi:O-antigen/teichoic acid export membrane protein
VDWFYQGIEKYGYIATRSFIVKWVAMLLMFCFVKEQNDYILYAIILCFATYANYIFNIIHIRKYVKLVFHKLNMVRHLKSIFVLLASSCATEVYTMLDSTMLGIICNDSILGYYSNAVRLIRSGFGFLNAICAVYLPRLSYLYKNGEKEEYDCLADRGLKINLMLAIPGTVGLFLLADLFVPILFGSAFEEAIITVKILSILLIVFSVAYIGGHIILISVNEEKIILKATCVGAVVNFLLNSFLIKSLQHNGAAIASVIAEILVTVILVKSAKKYVHYRKLQKYIKSILGATVIMGICVVICRMNIRINIVVNFISSVIGGILSYFITLYLLKNEIVINIMKAIKRFISQKI